ncbi:MFS transporter [Streptomyces sp. M10(2022)]
MAGSYLLITGFLQMVEGLSPVKAGLWMVPSAVASIVSAMMAPTMAKRFSMASVIAAGLVVAAGGYALMAFVDPVGGLPVLVVGFVVCFFGTGPVGALGTNLVVSSAPPEKSGSAASLQETSSHLGWRSASPHWAAWVPSSTGTGSPCRRLSPRMRPRPPGQPRRRTGGNSGPSGGCCARDAGRREGGVHQRADHGRRRVRCSRPPRRSSRRQRCAGGRAR